MLVWGCGGWEYEGPHNEQTRTRVNGMTQEMTESEFRQLAKAVYDRVEAPFDAIDPDEVECEVAQGALTIMLANGQKWILSQQPPVRQLWLAVASRGQAHHFNYRDGQWLDDKGQGLELLSYLAQLLGEEAGVEIRF